MHSEQEKSEYTLRFHEFLSPFKISFFLNTKQGNGKLEKMNVLKGEWEELGFALQI